MFYGLLCFLGKCFSIVEKDEVNYYSTGNVPAWFRRCRLTIWLLDTKKPYPRGSGFFESRVTIRCFLLRRLKSLVDIGNDVAHVFDPNREADEVRRDAGGDLFLGRELLVGGGTRMDHQALGVADVRQMRQ